jgi:hypothetical protein
VKQQNPRKSAQKISANQREIERRLPIKFTRSMQFINLALLTFTLSLETWLFLLLPWLFKLGSFSTGVKNRTQITLIKQMTTDEIRVNP